MAGLLPSTIPQGLGRPVRIVPSSVRPSGIGGYVGTHPDPRGSLFARRVLATFEVEITGGNDTAAATHLGQVVRTLLTQERGDLLPIQPGNYWLRLRADEGFGVWLGLPGPDKRPVWMLTPPAKGASTRIAVDLLVTPLEGQGAATDSVPRMTVALNGTALALSSPRSGAVAAQLAEVGPLAAAGPWSADVTTAYETTVTLQSVRVVYQP